MYCEASDTVNFRSVLAVRRAIEGGGLLSRGNGLEDHDQPIPRWLHKSSNASRKTVEADRRRSTGVSWGRFGVSYLLSGFLVNVHSIVLSAMQNTAHCTQSLSVVIIFEK